MNIKMNNELIEIKEESPLIETKAEMWIDSVDPKDNLKTILGFSFLLILILYIGLVETSPISQFQKIKGYYNSNMKRSLTQKISYDLSPISSLNRYVNFYVSFYRKDGQKELSTNASLKYVINKYNNKGLHKTEIPVNITLSSRSGSHYTNKNVIFRDLLIDYQSIDIIMNVLNADNKTFQGIELESEVGSKDFTHFNAYFRILFSIYFLGAAVLFLVYLKKRSILIFSMPIEQIILIPLILLMLFSTNPFFILQTLFPKKVYYYLNVIFDSLCDSYLYFVVLMLFESINNKNKKLKNYSFLIPSVCLTVLIGVMNCFHGIVTINNIFNYRQLIQTVHENRAELPKLARFVVHIFYVAWTLILIIKTCFAVDEVDSYKLLLYCFATSLMIFCSLLVSGLSDYVRMSEQIYSILILVLKNIFSMLLIYVHWPYESEGYIKCESFPADAGEKEEGSKDDNGNRETEYNGLLDEKDYKEGEGEPSEQINN